MSNIGPYGLNLQIAAKRIQNSKTPETRKFANQLANNMDASNLVARVDTIRDTVAGLDGSKHDNNGDDGQVSIDSKVETGFFNRLGRGFGDGMKFIATESGGSAAEREVKAESDGQSMEVFVKSGDDTLRIAYQEGADGGRNYTVGEQQVKMNPTGTLTTLL